MKTVKQIADELGVSKQAVHQKRKSKALSTALQPFTTMVDGVVYISVDGENLLKQAFLGSVQSTKPSTVDDNSFTPVNGHVDAPEHPLYTILKAELEEKNRQIKRLEDELETERQHSREQQKELVKIASQAQALHAGTMKQQGLEAGEPETEGPIEVVAPRQAEPAPQWWQFWKRGK